jgi:hypothetical protein
MFGMKNEVGGYMDHRGMDEKEEGWIVSSS